MAGKVVTPGDGERYELLRSTYTAVHSPAYVVLAEDEDDVAIAISFARAGGLAVAVRSGGHSLPGTSSNDGGLVIDLSAMDRVEILDRAARLVRVQAGARWAQVAAVLAPHGMAISSGDHGNVGVGGLATSGGIGWMVRAHGLTIDRVRAATVVLADGTAHRVDARQEPELFWAARGGGALIGIATEFDLEATETATVVIGQFEVGLEVDGGGLIRFSEFSRDAPRQLSATMHLFGAGTGSARASVTAVYAGDDPEAAVEAFAPISSLGTVHAQHAQLAPYSALVPVAHLHANVGQQSAYVHNGMVDTITPEVERAVFALLSPRTSAQLRTLGGAIGDVDPQDTAFGNRHQSVLVLGTAWTPDARLRLDADWAGLSAAFTGAYGNFESCPTAQTTRLAFPPATRKRLETLKGRYDPERILASWPDDVD